MKKILIILLMISTMISYSQDFSNLNGMSLHSKNCIKNPETSEVVYETNEVFTFSFNDSIFVHTILYLNENSNLISQFYTITEKYIERVEGGYIYHLEVQSGVSKSFYYYQVMVNDLEGKVLVFSLSNDIIYYGTASYVKSIKQ